VAIPELDLAAVVTSTNYNARGMHEQTDRILNDYVLAAVKPPTAGAGPRHSVTQVSE
jgi:hypothetical protein